ncbi:guanylate-binding protein 6-like [Branchiostoma floridae]|uniref:Guanylate-binding protein 6-like n=1 Tax=Branchiostoma floridae TaxID=7739 RepID=A0A9J7HQV1_BRAFL|nr:guanylate-binding protein 6-like [Branchiostoma floridae]
MRKRNLPQGDDSPAGPYCVTNRPSMRDKETLLADVSWLHSKLGFKVEKLTSKADETTIQGSSIPLILPNDMKYNASTGAVQKIQDAQRTSLQIVQEALALLEGIEEPVSVLAICGPCRTGKSYILSRLLGTSDAFELGHFADPQTFGIWMGTKVLRGKDFTIVLLDTEGIDAPAASAVQDASILVLTILLSSRVIYNSLNVPCKGDLEKMQCFIQLAKGLTVKKGEKIQTSLFHEFFPDFLWLLRDASLKFRDKNGKNITPTKYLITEVLESDPDNFPESTSDAVGRAILKFFPSVECKTLERPSEKKEVMNNIAQHTEKLNPEFNQGVENLTEWLLQKSRAKKGFDKVSTISGLALSIMAKQYVEAVNDPNSIPTLDNTWKNTIEVMRVRAIEEAVKAYKHQMHAKIAAATNNGKVPLEESEETEQHLKPVTRGRRKQNTRSPPSQPTLMDLHKKVLNDVTDIFLEKIGHFGISSGDQYRENTFVVEQMQKRLVQREERSVDYVAADGTTRKQEGFVVTGGELLQYIQQNRELSKSFCQDLFEQLPPANYDMKKLTRDLTDARQQYEKQARGPEKWVVLQEMIKDSGKLKDSLKKVKGYQTEVIYMD